MSLPGVTESRHMSHPDFRVEGRIFATLGYPDSDWGMVKLTPEQQLSFVSRALMRYVPAKENGESEELQMSNSMWRKLRRPRFPKRSMAQHRREEIHRQTSGFAKKKCQRHLVLDCSGVIPSTATDCACGSLRSHAGLRVHSFHALRL